MLDTNTGAHTALILAHSRADRRRYGNEIHIQLTNVHVEHFSTSAKEK